MPHSVSFADQLVTECFEIPRLSEDSVPDYFYSRKDIDRFQRIWKAIILQRMGQLESDECETRGNVVKKRTHDESNRDERLSSSKRRRFHDGNDKSVTTKVIDTPAEAVQVVRSVSPVER